MKLFYQLTQEEQDDAVHYYTHVVVDDMISEGVNLDPVTEDESELKEKLEEAIKHTKTLATNEEKTDYLFGNDEISKAIYDIALEMAKGAFYHSNDEMVVFIDELSCPDEMENNEDLLPETNTKKSKVSPLN